MNKAKSWLPVYALPLTFFFIIDTCSADLSSSKEEYMRSV